MGNVSHRPPRLCLPSQQALGPFDFFQPLAFFVVIEHILGTAPWIVEKGGSALLSSPPGRAPIARSEQVLLGGNAVLHLCPSLAKLWNTDETLEEETQCLNFGDTAPLRQGLEAWPSHALGLRILWGEAEKGPAHLVFHSSLVGCDERLCLQNGKNR